MPKKIVDNKAVKSTAATDLNKDTPKKISKKEQKKKEQVEESKKEEIKEPIAQPQENELSQVHFQGNEMPWIAKAPNSINKPEKSDQADIIKIYNKLNR